MYDFFLKKGCIFFLEMFCFKDKLFFGKILKEFILNSCIKLDYNYCVCCDLCLKVNVILLFVIVSWGI